MAGGALAWLGLVGCRAGPATARPAGRPTLVAVAATDPAPPAQAAARRPAATQAQPPDWAPAGFAADLREGFEGDVAQLRAPTIYRIDAHLNEPARSLAVRQEVRYVHRGARALGDLYFRLLPNQSGQGGALAVEAVSVPDRRAGWALALDGTALRVELEPPLLPGEALSLALTYRVVVPESNPVGFGIFSYDNGVFTLGHFYAWIPVHDEAGWHLSRATDLGDPTFTEAALYEVTLAAPAGMRVAGTGRLVEARPNPDGSVTTRHVAGPVRDFNLVAGRGLKSVEREVNGIRVASHYVEDHDEEALTVLGYAADALRVFERRFGPYPYRELDVVEAPVRAVGMEYPGLVLMGSQAYRPPAGAYQWPLEFTVVHEVAHQWWYGLVGSDQQGEPWLDEALATYAPILYYEEVYGPERARAELEGALSAPYEAVVALGLDGPVRQPVAAFTRQSYFGVVYAKGGLFVDALRREVGEAVFDRIMQSYLREFRYRNSHSDDFLRVAEREAGRSLGELYARWGVAGP